MTSLYQISNLHYGYKWGNQFIPVLRGINLDIPEHALVCLVGPSGMGKTTLLNLMGLLDKPQSGKLDFNSIDVTMLGETALEKLRLKELGFVFQAFYLIPTLTVLENTTYFLSSLGIEKKDAISRAEKTLSLLQILELKNKFPLELSGGQRQRVAIARALVKNPKVILADEPTANLDHKTAEDTIGIFKKLHEKDGVSFVFSTHDRRLESFTKKVFKIDDGKIATET